MCAETLQEQPLDVNGLDFLRIEADDAAAIVGGTCHQPTLLQTPQSFAHRRSRDAKIASDIHLRQQRPRLDLAAKNGVPKRIVYVHRCAARAGATRRGRQLSLQYSLRQIGSSPHWLRDKS